MSKSHARKELQDAGRAAARARREAEKAVAGVAAAGREVLDEARERVEGSVERAVCEGTESVRRRYDQAAEAVARNLGAAQKTLDSLREDVRAYARDNVGTLVLASGTAGFLAGWWMARRHRVDQGPSAATPADPA